MDIKKRINHNKEVFDLLCKGASKLDRDNQLLESLYLIKQAANFAYKNETGYFNSDILENTITSISQKVITSRNNLDVNKGTRVLHIVSEIFNIGGHSKLLSKWILRDNTTDSSVLATSMKLEDLQKVLAHHNLGSVPSMVLIGDDIQKSQELSEIAQGFNRVILHIHPNDIIPSLAFSSGAYHGEVYFMNHADHSFWVGKQILTKLILYRENIKEETIERRGISDDDIYVLPIPMDEIKIEATSSKDKPKELRNKLKLQSDDLVGICISSAYKLNRFNGYSFFDDIIKLLNQNPRYHFIMIGVDKKFEYAEYHERIHYMGRVNDPSPFLRISDIYIENMPYGSFTSLFLAMTYNIPIQLMYSDFAKLSSIDIFTVEDGFEYPSDYNDWKESIERLLANPEIKQKQIDAQNSYLINNNYSEGWTRRLTQLYQSQGPNKRRVLNESKYRNELKQQHLSALKSLNYDVNYRLLVEKMGWKNILKNQYLMRLLIKRSFTRLFG